MTAAKASLHWSPDAEGTARGAAPAALAERLEPLARDRATPAAELVVEASRALHARLRELPRDLGWDAALEELSTGLAAFSREQGWRACAARWLATIDGLLAAGPADEALRTAGPVAALHEELGLWIARDDEPGSTGPWSGVPLESGRRVADREPIARRAAGDLDPGEHVLTLGYSETVLCALRRAAREGKRPVLTVGEGAGDRSGLVCARHAARDGIRVRVLYDAALPGALPEVDRVWLGTEGFGGDSFLARVGTTQALERARAGEIPVELLATSDKLHPGRLAPPAWGTRERWLLWEEAPAGVELDPQPYELAPLALVDAQIMETGRRRLTAWNTLDPTVPDEHADEA